MDFWTIWGAKWSHVGTQMDAKMDLILKTPQIKKKTEISIHNQVKKYSVQPKILGHARPTLAHE